MNPLKVLRLACLICVFIPVSASAPGTNDDKQKTNDQMDSQGANKQYRQHAETYNTANQLCCGPLNDKKILNKSSEHHRCCGHNQYNIETECCCPSTLEVQPKTSCCCVHHSNKNTEDGLCEKVSACCEEKEYNPLNEMCCNSTVVTKCAPLAECCGGETYNTGNQLCCGPLNDKKILNKSSEHHRCCGHNQYNIETECCCPSTLEVQPKTSCCCVQQSKTHTEGLPPMQGKKLLPSVYVNQLSMDGEDGEECSDASRPYKPTKAVVCESQDCESSGQHCCGSEVYQPQDFICCSGHRHNKSKNLHCCGTDAYNISDPSKKCCAGELHDLKTGNNTEALCCGSALQKPGEVCCSSEDRQILYSNRTELWCCGHLQYHTSLWSCCSGRLSPVTQPGHNQSTAESTLPSVNNLNKAKLCSQIHVGIVESVSVNSTVFRNVLKIYGGNKSVEVLPEPHIWKPQEPCRNLKLTPGRSYFFDKDNIFTDFNHDSVLQSFYFILSRCSL